MAETDHDPLAKVDAFQAASIRWDFRREGRAWRGAELAQKHGLVPGRIEASDGQLCLYAEERLLLFALLLENVGLDTAVRLGDPERWREALEAQTNLARPLPGQAIRRPLSDTAKWVIYIDLDEVLPADGEPVDDAALSAWISRLADLVSPHEDVGIALHGTWNVKHSYAQTEMLVGKLDRLVIGVVDPGRRANSILAHIQAHPEVLDCLVLDRHVDEFRSPLAEHLVALDPGGGIRDPGVLEQVRAWIEARRSANPLVDPAEVRQRLLAGLVIPSPSPPPRDPEPDTVEAVVTLLIEEFQLVHLETADGVTLSVGEGTLGIDWRQLRRGQRLRCLLEGQHYSRVLSAELLPDDAGRGS